MHPRYAVEKEYLVEVSGAPSAKHVAALRRGVDLDDGPARAISGRIVGARGDRGQLRLVIAEGRKREVRRMLAAVGLPVTRLVRVRIGPVALGRLKPGELRELDANEVLGLGEATTARVRPGHRRTTRAL